jgi:subtilisin family serine protease
VSAPTVCDSLSLAKAIQFAIEHGAQIVNLSLTGPTDRLLARLIDIAVTRNISVVAAYDSEAPKGGFPASQPGVIAVSDDSLPSIPPGVYGAPGRDVPTTTPGGTWNLANGSSFAAAHVSGLLALVREDRSSSPRSMLAASRSNGGEVDACETLLRASKNCRCNCFAAAELIPAQQ